MSIVRKALDEIRELYKSDSGVLVENNEDDQKDMNEEKKTRTCPFCRLTEYVNESKVCLSCGHPMGN